MKPTVSESRTLRRLGSWMARSFGIESGEHARRGEDCGAGELIEECAFPCVGVADEGDGGDGDGLATLALLSANAANGFELIL